MTAKLADALLQASPTKSLSRYWPGLDLESVAAVALDLTQQPGHVLPAIRYDGSLVFPVVTLHHDAVRNSSGERSHRWRPLIGPVHRRLPFTDQIPPAHGI